MPDRVLRCLATLLAAAFVVSAAETLWIPAVAHTSGALGTSWRSDVAIVNPCEEDATVSLRLHSAAGPYPPVDFVIPAGEQQIFEDVVSQLAGDDVIGALEVTSDWEIAASSRSYTTAVTGSYGQGLAAVAPRRGAGVGATLLLSGLREDASFRANIGLLNTSELSASVTVDLMDRHGATVGSYQLQLPPRSSTQDNRPYRHRFDRTDILAGYAEITVAQGAGVFAYASVVDNSSGDPTTISATPAPACPVDISAQLAAIPGMTVEERPSSLPGTRFFVLQFEQPADHDDPTAGSFPQFLTLYHRDPAAPMVFGPLGYGNSVNAYPSELTGMLDANQLFVEHRFFGGSRPEPTDWSTLTIEQAAADHHRVVEAFKPIYPGPWVSTGISKGGMTAVYHRRFYPDDVDATVPYVAPILYGAPDLRFLDVLAGLGTDECRDALSTVQRQALARRQAMADLIADNYGSWTFDRIGLDAAMDVSVLETPFYFWMIFGQEFCDVIPAAAATDQEVYDFIDSTGWWGSYSDTVIEITEPYVYQASSQTGYPAIAWEHLADLLVSGPDREDGTLPPGEDPVFDPTVMPDIATWVATEGERLLFLYGETDPWTGGAFELGQAEDSFLFVAPGGNHLTSIAALEPEDQAQVMEILERWTGVTPDLPEAAPAGFEPWPRQQMAVSVGAWSLTK